MPQTIYYLELVVAFYGIVYTLHTVLDFRQLKAIRKPTAPPQLTYSPAEYKRTQSYNLDKWWFGFYRGVWSLALAIGQLLGGYLPLLWQLSAHLAAQLPSAATGEISTSIVFVLLEMAISTATDLPWSLYSTFVVETHHGFNKQTLCSFCLDTIKTWGLGLFFVPPLVAGLVRLLQVGGPYLALYLWGALLALSLVLMTVYPTLIAPLFNSFTPLPDGDLRTGIEELASSLRFPLQKLFVVDGSTRSAHSNAYMYGMGKNKRIVLYDTLLEQCGEGQVLAVLAHELGHWKLGHTWRNFVLGQAIALAQFGLFSAVSSNPMLLASFGFTAEQPVLISFILFTYLLGPVDEVISFLTNIISRRYEFQADAFAVGLGKATDLKAGLLNLNHKNKSSPHCDSWYSAFHYSHPPLLERLQAIDKAAKKRN